MLADISEFLLSALTHLILFVILLRLYLQLARANFRNPLAQAVMQLTSPLIVPVRRIVPPIGQIDTATLLVAYCVQLILLLALMLLRGLPPSGLIFGLALFELAMMSLRLFMFAIIIQVILSWVAPGTYNPAAALIDELTRPLLAPFRRWIRPFGGFDLSPLVALLALNVAMIVVQHLTARFMMG